MSTAGREAGFTVTISRAENIAALIEEFSKASGRDHADVLTQQAGLLSVDLTKVTPPFRSMNAKEPWATQKRTGEAAVERQIRGAIGAIDQLSLITSPRKPELAKAARKYINKGDVSGLTELLKACHFVEATRKPIVAEATTDLHKSMRDTRGRIPETKRVRVRVFRQSSVNALVRKKKKNVGMLKAGNVAGIQKFGKGNAAPAWISKHPNHGVVLDKSAAWLNPEITFGNTVGWSVSSNDRARFSQFALGLRAGAIERQLNAKIEGRWRQMPDK